jgi:putative DNA primase/helicase
MTDDERQGAATRGNAPTESAERQTPPPDAKSGVIDFAAIPPAEGFDKLEALQVEIARLAALPELVYAQVRKDEAKRLGISPISTLDKAVKQARPKDEDTRAGSAVVLPEVEPWPDPVDGAELLDEIMAQLTRFVVADEHQLRAVALWILHTHCFEAWWISPKLLVESATKRCGKTRLFEVLERLVRRKLMVSSATSSSVFRVIEANRDAPPTLLMDEADYLTEKDDNMRKLINAAQQKAEARVLISVPSADGGWESRLFSTWAPIALAGLGTQAATIRDRSIVITMRRKTRDQPVEKLRGNKDYGFHELARKCARWAADHVEELKDAEPAMPMVLHDRAQDNWEPLIAIADAAGGDWPQRARNAAARVLKTADELDAPEVGVQLIHDIMDVLDGGFSEVEDWPASWVAAGSLERVPVGYLLLRLRNMGERIWSTYGKRGEPLKDYELAELLRPFGVRSKQLKFNIGGEELNRKGFERRQFAHLLLQYPRQPSTPLLSAENLDDGVTEPSTCYGEVDGSVTPKTAENLESRGVEGSEGVHGDDVAFQRQKRLCLECGKPLSVLAHASRVYCSDSCRVGHHRSTENVKPNGEAATARVPFMLTQKMKADLRGLGFSDAQIREMTPEQAHAHIASGNGAARYDGRVNVDELKALCRRAAEAKGKGAVEAAFKRLGIRRLNDDLKPEQGQALRAEIEAMLQ